MKTNYSVIFSRALVVAREVSSEYQRATALITVARLAMAAGDFETARQALNEAKGLIFEKDQCPVDLVVDATVAAVQVGGDTAADFVSQAIPRLVSAGDDEEKEYLGPALLVGLATAEHASHYLSQLEEFVQYIFEGDEDYAANLIVQVARSLTEKPNIELINHWFNVAKSLVDPFNRAVANAAIATAFAKSGDLDSALKAIGDAFKAARAVELKMDLDGVSWLINDAIETMVRCSPLPVSDGEVAIFIDEEGRFSYTGGVGAHTAESGFASAEEALAYALGVFSS